ncbi:hypothetical protein RCL1_006308 [Eukaryota sp. TZLM3-RCL]
MESKVTAFWDWVVSSGFKPDGIELRSQSLSRIGVFATKDLPTGHPIFTVPADFILSIENSCLAKTLKNRRDLREIMSDDVFTALSLCVIAELVIGEKSKWFPYLSLFFPPACTEMPLFWSTAEGELLKNTSIDPKGDLDHVTMEYNTILRPLFRKYPSSFSSSHFNPTLQNYLLVGAFVQAYSFASEEGIPYLLPLADALNSRPGMSNCRIVDDDDSEEEEEEHDHSDDDHDCSGCCGGKSHDDDEPLTDHVMATSSDVSAGQELLNTYGEVSNFDLLQKYGYVDTENPFKAAEISIKLFVEYSKKHPLYHRRKKFIKASELFPPSEDMDLCYEKVTPNSIPLTLFALCASLTVSDEALSEIFVNNKLLENPDESVVNEEQLASLLNNKSVAFTSDEDDADFIVVFLSSRAPVNETVALLKVGLAETRRRLAVGLDLDSELDLSTRAGLANFIKKEQVLVLDELLSKLNF